MGNGTRTVYPYRLNKGFISEFHVDYPDGHTSDRGRSGTQQSKRCDKVEDNSPKIHSVNNSKYILGNIEVTRDQILFLVARCFILIDYEMERND